MRGLAHGGVFHLEVASDGSHNNLAGIQPHPRLDPDPVGPEGLLGVVAHRTLESKGRVAASQGVILMGDGRAEERHDSVPHHLGHRSLVSVDGLHHAGDRVLKQGACVFGVPVRQKLHGALEVPEEHRYLLSLALEGGLGGQDSLSEVLGGIGLGGGEPRLRGLGG